MTGLAFAFALQSAAHQRTITPPREPGVDLRQELRGIQRTKGEQLKLITRSYEPKTIALTFDDGPHGNKTLQLLAVLKQLDVKATFFVVGKMVDKAPWLVREEFAQGHEIGNHTYDHPNLDKLSDAQVA